MHGHFKVPGGGVLEDVIDGEAIIIDLESGCCYSTDGLGAVIWRALADGYDTDSVSNALASAGVSPDIAQRSVADLVAALLDYGLLEPAEPGSVPAAPLILPSDLGASAAATAIPTLERYDQMARMIQLDPVHDVDVTGWPAPAPRVPGTGTAV